MKDKKKLQLTIIAIVITISIIFIYKGAIAPKLYDKYLNTGIKYLMDGQYEEAILAFDKAIKIDPKTTESRVYQAKAYAGNEEFNKVVEVLEEAQKIDMTNEELLKEILEILNEIDSDIAYEFLDKFIDAIGEANISQDIRDILDSSNEAPSEPIVDPVPSKYIKSVAVKLNQDKMRVGHSYYYTLDGSEPTKSSQKYRGKILIDKSSEVKIIGFNKAEEFTEIISLSYTIDTNLEKEIIRLIKDGESLINTVETGNKVGNCIEGSKEKLTESIESTQKALNKKVVSYENAIEIKENIDKAIDDFKYNIIEKTNKKELKENISSAQKLHDNAVEGSNEGQYEPGAKSYLANILKDAKKLNESILAKQDEINDMVKKIENAKEEFKNKKVKSMPNNLGQKYLSRIRYEESKANAIYNDLYSSMSDIRNASYEEAQAYKQILQEIYIDLNKYLSVSKKQEVATNKMQFENEKNKILRDLEAFAQKAYEEFGAGALGTSYDGGESKVGELAKEYALNLISKYMK